jgi:hypothetical protein
MKTFFQFLFVLFVLFTTTNALYTASPDWIWAKSAGDSHANSVTFDGAGNVITVGTFTGRSITFDSITLTNRDTSGSGDIFIVKHAPNGNVLWAKSAGSMAPGPYGKTDYAIFDHALSVTVDSNDNIFVAGTFSGQNITFGSFTLMNSTVPLNSILIVKFDNAGNVLWADNSRLQDGHQSHSWVNSIAADQTGNILMTGSFASTTITFGTITLTNSGTGGSDLFLVKYNNAGGVLWAVNAGGSNNHEVGNCVTTDAGANVFVTGNFFSDTMAFGPIILTNEYPGSIAMFVAKFNSSGNILWAKGTSSSWANSATADHRGNVFTVGKSLVKYDPAGNILWKQLIDANSIASDAEGNIYVGGNFWGTTLTFGSTTLIGIGNEDVFAVKFDNSGNPLWAQSAGGIYPDYANSIDVDRNGNVVLAGVFEKSAISFGSITLANVGDTTYADMFVAKLSLLTEVSGHTFIPNAMHLSKNYPNPFNPSTKIEFRTDKLGIIKLAVYNLLGQEIAVLVNEKKEAGSYEVRWDASQFPSGTYFYRLQAGQFQDTKKMILMK